MIIDVKVILLRFEMFESPVKDMQASVADQKCPLVIFLMQLRVFYGTMLLCFVALVFCSVEPCHLNFP